MWRSALSLTGAVLVAFLNACAPAAPAFSAADADAVRATVESYRKHALAGEWDDWGKTLAPDVVYMVPNQLPIRGRDAAVKFGKSFPKIVALTITAPDVAGHGDLAYDQGSWSSTVEPTPGTTAADSGSHLDVFKNQPDGSWLFAQAIWHSDVPLATAAPAPLATRK